MVIVAVIFGAIVGVAALQSVGGLIIGGAIGYLVAEISTLNSRIRVLEQSITQSRSVEAHPSSKSMESPPVPVATPPAPTKLERPNAEPLPVDSLPQPLPPPSPLDHEFSPPPAQPTIFDNAVRVIRGFFTEGNTVVRVGVIVLFFGIAFLLKYAAEHARLPIELRLSGVALGAIGLLAFGARVRRKREGYGLTLEGGAIGILSLTIFAAFRLYGLLPATAAFALLIVTFAAGVILALKQNSLALAALGISGAFLAPVLASTGSGSHVALFSYYVLVNAAILIIAWFRAWRLLNLLGFAFTFVIGSAWGYRFYRPEFFSTTEPFLIVFLIFYLAVAVLFARRQPPELRHPVDGTLVFGVPIVGFLLQAALVKDFEYGLAWSAFVLGAGYIGLTWFLLTRGYSRLLVEAFLALGVIFVTLTIPLAVDGHWTAAAWAIEGAGVLWVGLRQSRWLAQVFGLLVQLGAGVYFGLEGKLPGAIAVINSAFLGATLISGAGVVSGYLLERYRDRASRIQPDIVSYVLLIWGLLWWFGGTFNEIEHHVLRDYRVSAALALVAATTLVQHFVSAKFAWPRLRHVALFNLAWLYISLPRAWLSFAHPFAKLGFIAWPSAVAAYYFALKHAKHLSAGFEMAVHAGAFWLSLFVVGWELQWLIDQWLPHSDWPNAIVGIFLAGLLATLLASRAHLWPVRDHQRTYLVIGAVPIVMLAFGWILIRGVLAPGNPAPLPYLPLLNPLDLATLFLLLALLQWSYRTRALTELSLEVIVTGLGLAAFAWLNAVLFRTIHHFEYVPYTTDAMFHSILAQASLSIFWTVLAFALMMIAKHLSVRQLWVIGAILLGVVVLKLFVVDLSGTGTIARIVSFVGVGALLLVIGYLVPVPPRAVHARETPS
jgi:uncharacterized membrane protein